MSRLLCTLQLGLLLCAGPLLAAAAAAGGVSEGGSQQQLLRGHPPQLESSLAGGVSLPAEEAWDDVRERHLHEADDEDFETTTTTGPGPGPSADVGLAICLISIGLLCLTVSSIFTAGKLWPNAFRRGPSRVGVDRHASETSA
mmetsp:Transcript_93216/g.240900  ORF Transcript_93216/g.240900 Transcript_93216/m.240900 type:complete len:143 (+) Transcript_93216:111-539(+)